MAKIEKNSLGYLGHDFQLRLISQLLTDDKFASSIIEIIDPNYFEDEHLRIISATIKDTYSEYEIIPDMGSLEARLLERTSDTIQRKFLITKLQQIKDVSLKDSIWVQETSMKFCKQQELKKSIQLISKIIDRGDINDYNKCEEIIKKAIEYGSPKDDGINVTDDIDNVLADDYRNPIPTGINGLDEAMDGGLGASELGVILMPFGVGKTTMATKICNTAKNLGKNVVQIIFEDHPKVIQRKHLSCWSGYELNNLILHREELKEINERKKNEPGILIIKKFVSGMTTVYMIRQYLRKLIAKGIKIDLIVIDYVECLISSIKIDDQNVADGIIMREIETMIDELQIAGWVCTQGNRSSIKSAIVDGDQMGGSIKKAQIGHFIITGAKSLEQKENGTANMAIIKSRFGLSGLIFQDIIFNNATIQIDMSNNGGPVTHSQFKSNVGENNQNRVNVLLEAANRLKQITQDNANNIV